MGKVFSSTCSANKRRAMLAFPSPKNAMGVPCQGMRIHQPGSLAALVKWNSCPPHHPPKKCKTPQIVIILNHSSDRHLRYNRTRLGNSSGIAPGWELASVSLQKKGDCHCWSGDDTSGKYRGGLVFCLELINPLDDDASLFKRMSLLKLSSL